MINYRIIFGLLLIGSLSFTSCKVKNTEDVKKSDATSVEKKNDISKHNTGDVKWLSMGEIEEAIKKDPKPVMVDVYTKWCGPCKMLDKKTFSDKEVQDVFREHFHVVKFDAEGADDIVYKGKTFSNPKHVPGKRGRNSSHQLSSMFKVRGYPSMIVLDKNLQIIDKIVGFRTAEQLIADLQKHIK